jgi:hypothetical protein
MPRDPHNPYQERTIGLAMLGVVFFFAATGLGVGAFVAEPEIGGICGSALGIAFGVLFVPPLMRDLRD